MFILIFWAICFVGTFYFLWRFYSFWGWKHRVLFWALTLLLSFGYIGANLVDHNFPSAFSRLLLHLSALWLGVGWLGVCLMLLHDVLRLLTRFPVTTSRWVFLAVFLVLIFYSLANARLVRVRIVKLPAPVDMDIAQLSDVHLGSITEAQLAEIVRKTNLLEPDLVLITGDLMDSYSGITAESLSPIDDLEAPVYWTVGNHERYMGLDQAMRLLSATRAKPLRNEQVRFNGIQIIGIDDSGRKDQVARVLDTIPLAGDDAYKILMFHRPLGMRAAADAGIDLMLSGHTHFGQIVPFNLLVRTEFDYIKGTHRIGPLTLHVSTGTGYWGPPMRLGSRSEITLIHLRKPKTDNP